MNKLKKIFLTAVATLTVATVSAAGETDGSAVTVTCGNGVRTGSTDFCRWLIS